MFGESPRALRKRRTGEGAWFVTFNTVPEIPEALVSGRDDIFSGRIHREVAHDEAATTEEDVAA